VAIVASSQPSAATAVQCGTGQRIGIGAALQSEAQAWQEPRTGQPPYGKQRRGWSRRALRALAVVCVFFIFQQITGINVPRYFGPHLFVNPGLRWDDLAWLRSLTDLPILLNGVLRADDARRALDTGVANHGGRQVDGSVSPCKDRVISS
jgi:hypothetical protein